MKLTREMIRENRNRVIECRVGNDYYTITDGEFNVTTITKKYKNKYDSDGLEVAAISGSQTSPRFFISATLKNNLIRSFKRYIEIPFSAFKVVAIYPQIHN